MLAYQFMQRILVISLLATVIACSESSTPDKIQSRSNDSSYDYSILEGDSGSKTISISYDSGSSESIVYETFNITAAEKSDYESVSEELQVRKGTSYTIDLTIYSDEEIEGTETFGIRFKSNDGNVLEEKTIQILNDDFPALSVNKPEVAEADVGTSRLRFQFVLEDPVVDDYKVLVSSISVDDVDSEVLDRFPNIATPDIDYESVEQEFTFTNNTDVHELNINVLSEDIVENNEYVLLKVQNIDGLDVLTEQYAIGVIRTDETPKINGFEIALADADADRILITEGPLQADQKDSWQPYSVEFKVDKPENIIEDQNISVRLLSEADYKELVTNDNYDYVDTGLGQFDLCLSLPNTLPSNTEECEIQQWTTLEPDQATLSYDIYVNQDLVRENSEDFVLLLENDQGVEFAAIFGQILNDDQEELTLIRPDTQETVYLKDLASDIELFEPKENEQTYRFEFALDSEISNTYEVEYEVVSFLPRSPASLNEFSDISGTLEFNPNTESLYIDITLYADKTYDGDKYIQIRFKEDGLNDIVIKIVDVDLPEIAVRSTDDIEIDDEGRYILHEQAEKSYGRDVVDQESTLYSFELSFLGTTTALADRTYNIKRMFNTVDPSEYDSSECQANQIYRDSDQLGFANASGDDLTLIAYEHYEEDGQQKLRQLTNPTEITIKRNTSSVSFAIEVQNDTDIECLERFSVRFSPQFSNDETNNTEDSIALVGFSISNRDAAIIEVQGFTVDEPETGDIQANLTLTSSHPIELPLGLTLSPSVDNTCNTDSNVDIEFSTNQSTSFVSSLQQVYPVFIKADDLVELDEECHLSASLVTNESLKPAFETSIQHQCVNNGAACSEQNLDYVASKINNTDKLDVTVSLVNTKMNESGNVIDQETGEKTLKFARFAWNKAIASNVPEGTISLNAVLNTQSCSANYCADGEDFNDSPRVNITSASNKSTFLLTEIQNDDQFEKSEYASFDVSVESGSEYVRSFPSSFAIDILENDPATITVEKENDCDRSDSDADFNEERECKITYSFRSSADASSDISLDINALFESDLTLNSEQYEDAAIYFYDPATESSKDKIDLGSNQSVQLDIMDGGNVTSKQLIIEFHSDDVVELDETFSLSFSKGEGTDYNLDLTNVSDESYVFNNDDLLTVTIQNTDVDELSTVEEISYPFSFSRDRDVAPDVPTIQLALSVKQTCDLNYSGGYCVSKTGNNDDYQNATSGLINIHTQDQDESSSSYTKAHDINGSTPIQIYPIIDTLVERDETITIEVTSKSSDIQSVEGLDYLAQLNPMAIAEERNSISKSALIRNNDFLKLTIVEDQASSCEDWPSEGSCKAFTVSWLNQEIGENVGGIPLSIATQAPNEALNVADLSSGDEELNPKDFKINVGNDEVLLSSGSFNLPYQDNTENKFTYQFDILNDQFVEPIETLAVLLTVPDDELEVSIESDQSSGVTFLVAASIPIDDQLDITFSKADDSPEPSDLNGVSTPFTYKLSNKVAPNVPDIYLQTNYVSTEAINDSDYSVDSEAGQLHVANNATIDKDVDKSLGLTILHDDVVELSERVSATFELPTAIHPFVKSYSIVNGDENLNFDPIEMDYSIADTDAGIVTITKDDQCISEEEPDTDCTIQLSFETVSSYSPEFSSAIKFLERLDNSASIGEATRDDVSIKNISDQDNEIPLSTNESIDLIKNGDLDLTAIKIAIADDEIYELDEKLDLDIQTDGDNASRIIINNITRVEQVINNDDVVKVQVESEETIDEDLSQKPFKYKLLNPIQNNVDHINLSLTLTPNCPAGEVCADSDDFTALAQDLSVSLHTFRESHGYTEPTEYSSLNIIPNPDNLVEREELLSFNLSGILDGQESSDIKFYESVNDTLQETDALATRIDNQDTINLKIEADAGNSPDFPKEGTVAKFNISWDENLTIADNVSEVIVDITPASGNTASNSEQERPIGQEIVITGPQDYRVKDSSASIIDNIDLSTFSNEGSITVEVIDDDYVEPSETFKLKLETTSDLISDISDSTGNSGAVPQEYVFIDSAIPVQDILELTVTLPSSTGVEPGDTEIETEKDQLAHPVSVSFSGSTNIALNAPFTVSVVDKGGCSFNCASYPDDFTLDTLTINESLLDDNGYNLSNHVWNPLVIKDDHMIEYDENLNIEISESSEYVTIDGKTESNNSETSIAFDYEIKNGDKAIIAFENSNDVEVSEQNKDDINLNVTVNKTVADNGPDVFIEHNLDSTYFSYTSNSIDLKHTELTYTLSASTKDNSFIEENKGFNLTVTPTTGSEAYITNPNGVTKTITVENNDYISFWLDDAGPVSEGETKNLNWEYPAGYTLNGDAESAIEFSFSSDKNPENDIEFNLTSGVTVASGTNSGSVEALSVVDDQVLEEDETHVITLQTNSTNASDFVKIEKPSSTITNSYPYTIYDEDLIVEITKNVIGSTDQNIDFKVEFCLPSSDSTLDSNVMYNLSIENDADALLNRSVEIENDQISDLSTPVIDKNGYSNSYKNAVCGQDNDYTVSSTTCDGGSVADAQITLATGDFTSAGDCKEVTLFNIKAAAQEPQPNKHIQYNLQTSDTHAESVPTQQLVIANGNYPFVADTGLKKCLNSSRNAVDCSVENNGTNAKYLEKQDAAVTAGSPDLSYTGIDSQGKPALARMDQANNIVYGGPQADIKEQCFQDNNTGFIWMKTMYELINDELLAKTYTYSHAVLNEGDEFCGIQKKQQDSWHLPSVQDLYSVMAMKHLKIDSNGKPRQTMRQSSASQNDTPVEVDYNNDGVYRSTFSRVFKSAYWSSDACQSDNVSGFWTVDFFTGITRCEPESNENFKILVYKPQ